MRTTILDCVNNSSISEFAMKNYRTYVAHYESRNLIPMPLDEFLKNYVS